MPKLFGIDVSADVYEANRHLEAAPAVDKTEARRILEAEMKQQFARQFEATWRLLNGPALEKEVKIDDSRRWRGDYAFEITVADDNGNFVKKKYLVELDGGVWTKGRHTRGKGYIEDCFKLNQASLMGYSIIRIATGMATADYLRQIIGSLTCQEKR